MFVSVLGIDPGLTRCGYGLVKQGPNKTLEFLNAGVFSTSPQAQLSERLAEMHRDIIALVEETMPDQIAIERIFFKSNTTTALSVAQVSGLVHSIAASKSIPVVEYSPTEVKNSITGDGKADKLQVQTMVAKLLSLSKLPQPVDAADALAISIVHLGTLKSTKSDTSDSAIYNGSNLHNAIADAIYNQGKKPRALKRSEQKREDQFEKVQRRKRPGLVR